MHLNDAQVLNSEGRFAEAERLLSESSVPTQDKLAAEILRLKLAERLGHYARARFLAEKALRARQLPVDYQSDCRYVIGKLDLFEGRTEAAIQQLERALVLALEAKDHARVCWIRLRLLSANSEQHSAQAVARWISECRRDVALLGDPRTSATLHIVVGEIAAKHGAVITARRHTELAQKLLKQAPNVWLQAWSEITLVALAIIQGDVSAGRRHATSALVSAELSGAAGVRVAALGNLGNLSILANDWSTARYYYEAAADLLPIDTEQGRALLESTARLHLQAGDLQKAQDCLETVQRNQSGTRRTGGYIDRHTQLTKSVVSKRAGRLEDALAELHEAEQLAEQTGDQALHMACGVTRADILAVLGRSNEFVRFVDEFRPDITKLPVELLGHYERVIGIAAASCGDSASALTHFRRAARAFRALGHRLGQKELELSADAVGMAKIGSLQSLPVDGLQPSVQVAQDVLSVMLHVGRPHLQAAGMVELLWSTGCVASATAMTRDDDGHAEEIVSFRLNSANGNVATLQPRSYDFGRDDDRSIEVSCEPLHTVEAVATVNAVASLLEVVKDLDAARAEREERLGLWPIEEFPDDEDGAVISGAMREVMRLARKVAPTSATVLLTGESGTGKEVVARAIHRFATRPGHSFVPFNCHAVPRELLESHLFGYRRGAFTGAERDHPGVIRTAKEGTLFLDEIGELGLESQPKLLRFLESNEIHPLGETEPVKVKTRIVAATNANLEALVNEGKFRADLFYRLRVVPIQIPPLRERRDEIPELALHFVAKAAQEYGKGQITIDDETLELLTLYSWPGNVRQLNNELRRIVALADSDVPLTADMLPPEIRRSHSAHQRDEAEGAIAADETLAAALGRVEKQMIAAALKTYRGKLDETAKALGISRKGLYLKRLRFGL